MTHYIPQTAKVKNIFDSAKNVKTFVFEAENFNCKPGQFVNLWVANIDEKPFSVARDTGKEIWLTISKVGPFTEEVFKLKKGDLVGIRGPYGKGFSVLKNKKIALIGGGFGMAPLHFLGEELIKNKCEVFAILGARNKDFLIFEEECQKSGFKTFIATDDGSKGKKGFSTDLLEDLIKKEQLDAVQTCGPEKMMEKVAKICQKNKIFCEISMERYMKCGFGICGQCVCGGKRMCVDGPVVDGNWALEQEEFGKYKRGPEGQKEFFNK